MAFGDGLNSDSIWAVTRTIQIFETLATKSTKFRMTAALSDGKRLFAVRYASDVRALSLYHSWNAQQGGRAVVSESIGAAESVWEEVPNGSFCIFNGKDVDMTKL